MKKLIIAYLLLLVYGGLSAQENKSSLYLSSGYDFGNYMGASFNLNFIFNNKLSFQIGCSANSRKSPTQPSDYIGNTFFGRTTKSIDWFNSGYALMGKTFWLNETNTSRLNFLGGLGFTTIRESSNWVRVGGGTGYYYIDERNRYTPVSIVLNPKVEFTGKNSLGTSISLIVQANSKRTLFGVGLGIMIGDIK